MSDFQAIADRAEIEALRDEFTDAVMINDHSRLTSMFTPGGAARIPCGSRCLEGVWRWRLSAFKWR